MEATVQLPMLQPETLNHHGPKALNPKPDVLTRNPEAAV